MLLRSCFVAEVACLFFAANCIQPECMNKLIIALIAMVAMILGTGIYLNLPPDDDGAAKMGASFAPPIAAISAARL